MSIVVCIVLVVLCILFGPKPLITILIYGFIGWLLCDIDVYKEYSWYSGIWQGLFFVPNYVRHLVWDTPFKAEMYTTAYNIFYWIFSVFSTIGYLFGSINRN